MGRASYLTLCVFLSLMFTSGVGAPSNEHSRDVQKALIIRFFHKLLQVHPHSFSYKNLSTKRVPSPCLKRVLRAPWIETD